jgi:succinate dehydrogenase / fumarate reductase iron-sulfur subunit
MKILLKILRYDPENGKKPYFTEYEVDGEKMESVLDQLMKVKRFQDGTLAFRKSCSHGVCGSDAMVINGTERLACKTLVQDVVGNAGDAITIEPLRTLPVERDLMVEQRKFFQNYRLIKPFLINDTPVKEKERIQSPEERKKIDDATKCILCASCYSACPVIQEQNLEFVGPAAIVQAARFLDDTRDRGFEARLDALDAPHGVWPCENHFKCTQVCPRGIKVTKQINLTKNKIKKYRKDRGEELHDER